MKKKEQKDLTIVIVNDFDYVQGGASKVALETAKILHQNGYNVFFFSGTHQENEYLKLGFKNITLNMEECLKDKNKIRGALRGLYNVKAKKELRKLLKTLDPNKTIIHVHGWTKTLSSSVFSVAFKMNFKIVLTLHDYFTACPNGGFFNYKKNEICKLKPLSNKCICTNCDSRNYAFKMYRVVRQFIQNKVLYKKIENVISISDFSERILKPFFDTKVRFVRINNPIKKGKTNIKPDFEKNSYYLYVGRISKEKGVDIFCEAITALNAYGIVVGDGEERANLEKKYPNITFAGWKNDEEVEQYMLKAKALIFPSRWYEGAPLTPIEAMRLGIPCIVSNNSAATDYIIEGSNGFIFQNLEHLICILKNFNMKKMKKMIYKEDYYDQLTKYYEKILLEKK